MREDVHTPFFLIDEKILSQNINGFKEALEQQWPNSIIAYSVKTNSLPWILKWMNIHEVYAEVVSDEEYELAQLSGYTADKIVFNGPIKSNEYLDKAIKGGSIVNLDSQNDLNYIVCSKEEGTKNIGIRINIDPSILDASDIEYVEDGFRFGFSDKHGKLTEAIKIIKDANIYRCGLHLHVNSKSRSLNMYRELAKYASKIVSDYNLNPSYIDIGGGFFGGVPGKPSPYEYIKVIKDELLKSIDPLRTKLILEPGSAAIGSAVEMHTSVLDVKDTSNARIVTTDGSRVNIDPLWIKKRYFYSTTATKQKFSKQIICGYTCMDHDRIMIIEDQPELSVGDKIIYKKVGNYTVTFGGPFIKPFPPVYVKNGEEIRLVRKKMTMKEYYRMESV